jgi:hypothetical protein
MPTISRSQFRVRRSDGQEYPNVGFAYRQLLGTATELGGSEHHRIRAALRRGLTARDRYGFTWSAVGTVRLYSSVEAAVAAVSGSCAWTDFTFGVEIECINATYSHQELQAMLRTERLGSWEVRHDGSLSMGGHEVVSPVLKGQAGLDQLKKVMDFLKQWGCSVNNSCGMHVHVGVRDLPIQTLRNLSLQFLAAERHFDCVLPRSRSTNHYCQSNLRHHPSAVEISEARTARQLAVHMNGGWSTQHYNSYRYHKLNFQSFALHGTVEFRQHSGTVESAKACAWVRLITGFVAAAANAPAMTAVPTINFDQFLAVTDEDGQRFFQGRQRHFAGVMARAA